MTEREQAARAKALKERGLRMTQLRERAGIATQLDAMRKSQISQSTLSGIEAGKSDMYLTTACELADLYAVPLDVVACRAPIPPAEEPYPARMPIVMSPEFAGAPEPVRRWFATVTAEGAETWSTLAWARMFDDALSISSAGVRLRELPVGTTPLVLVKPPSQPPSSSRTPKPPSTR